MARYLKIKPLEWDVNFDDDDDYSAKAETPCFDIAYVVVNSHTGDGYSWWRTDRFTTIHPAPTVEKAKADAQADWDSHIGLALE